MKTLYEETTQYRPDIDGLRAIANLTVMLYHCNRHWLPGGFIGVDIFFVISGYVVTGSLKRGQESNVLGNFTGFIVRRCRRILPALLVCVLASVIFSCMFVPDSWLSERNYGTALADTALQQLLTVTR